MITQVLTREPAHQESAPARGLADQFPAYALAARAEALFTSDLSARCEYTQIEVAAAIRHAIGTHDGIGGCLGEVAAAYGEHPETAARRMRWARAVIESFDAPVSWTGVTT
jgi:hypothetical protein